MTRLSRRLLWTIAAVAIVLGAGVVAVVRWWPNGPPRVPPRLVPAAWAQYRTSPGHQIHVSRLNLECGACHDFERDGFRNPGTDVCKNCHAKESAIVHRGGSGRASTGCLTCHAFALGGAPACIDCHKAPEGEFAAIAQHATADCARCHRVHESPSIVAADCTGCHAERAPEHDAHDGAEGCRNCHHVHAPAATALGVCGSCHKQAAESHPSGHDGCTGCHRPHAFAAVGRVCVSCHGEATLAAEVVPAHAICTSCHLPHEPERAAYSCARCHANIQVEHDSRDACINCHAIHGGANAVALACTVCHSKVAALDTDAHAGGVACEQCHKPHQFSLPEPRVVCAGCHARETSLVATNAGHQDCTSCHGAAVAHAPARAPACGACHAPEEASAPAGHARCTECHDAHAGLPAPACGACHESEANGAHGSVPGGCATCHRPHGPGGLASPPTCTSCHARGTLPALHAAAGHARCTDCHVTPHAPPRDDRATCTGTCHADRRTHQPQATVCTGCHVFRR